MKTKKLLLLVGSVCLALVLVVPFVGACAVPTAPAPTAPAITAPTAEVLKWRMTVISARGKSEWLGFRFMADAIEEMSGGRIEIEVYGGAELMPSKEVYGGVSEGVIDLATDDGGYGVDRTGGVSGFTTCLPYISKTIKDIHVFLYETGAFELIQEVYMRDNVYYIRGGSTSPAQLLTNFPVYSVDDLEGRTLRAIGTMAEVMAEAEMAVTYFPPKEIYGALERGLIESVIYAGLAAEYERGFHEVTKYISRPALGYGGGQQIMNLDTWEALPDDLKAIVKTGVLEAEIYLTTKRGYTELQYESDMVKNWGHTVTTMAPEDVAIMAQHTLTVFEKYAKMSPDATQLYQMLIEFVEMM